MLRLYKKNYTLCLRVYMKLLRAVIYVNKQKIVQQKIFYKVILVKPLLVRNDEILYLENGDLADHISVLAAPLHKKHILQLPVVQHLKKLTARYYLTVRGRHDKRKDRLLVTVRLRKAGRQNLTVRINYA